MPARAVAAVLSPVPLHKIRFLGGKLGRLLRERLHVETAGDLVPFSLAELRRVCGERDGEFAYNACRGTYDEEGAPRSECP